MRPVDGKKKKKYIENWKYGSESCFVVWSQAQWFLRHQIGSVQKAAFAKHPHFFTKSDSSLILAQTGNPMIWSQQFCFTLQSRNRPCTIVRKLLVHLFQLCHLLGQNRTRIGLLFCQCPDGKLRTISERYYTVSTRTRIRSDSFRSWNGLSRCFEKAQKRFPSPLTLLGDLLFLRSFDLGCGPHVVITAVTGGSFPRLGSRYSFREVARNCSRSLDCSWGSCKIADDPIIWRQKCLNGFGFRIAKAIRVDQTQPL